MAMKAKKTTEQESGAQAQPAGNATKSSATAKDGGKPRAGKAAGKSVGQRVQLEPAHCVHPCELHEGLLHVPAGHAVQPA